MAPEQLVGVILLAVVLLINLIGRLLGRTEVEVEPLEHPQEPRSIPGRGASRPLRPITPRRQDKKPERGTQRARIDAPVGPGPRLRDRLKHRHTLRKAVVFMTVLGTCRGLEWSDPPR